MAVSKATMLDAFSRFKVLQDKDNADKFVAKEEGKSLMTDAEHAKLAGIAPANYVTQTQMQAFATSMQSIFGGGVPDGGGGTQGGGDDTGGSGTGGGGNTNPPVDPEDEGDEEITDDDLANLFH